MLILQVKLPRSVFPLARVCTAFVNFLYSLIAYLCILLFFRIPLTWYMLLYPVITAMVFLFALGLSYILSVLYVFFGDVRHLYSVVLTLWMYLSALFYPLELLPAGMQLLIRQNPVYNFIAAARDCILYGTMPGGAVWVRMILWSGGILLDRNMDLPGEPEPDRPEALREADESGNPESEQTGKETGTTEGKSGQDKQKR